MRVEESNLYYDPHQVRQPKQVLDKDAFMQILVTQLRYQDPSSPMDTDAFITQLTQFTMLEQTFNINKNLESLIQNERTSQILALIGKEVSVLVGEDEVITGLVESVSLAGDEPKVLVAGKYYSAGVVFEVNNTPDAVAGTLAQIASDVSTIAGVMVPEEEPEEPGEEDDV